MYIRALLELKCKILYLRIRESKGSRGIRDLGSAKLREDKAFKSAFSYPIGISLTINLLELVENIK